MSRNLTPQDPSDLNDPRNWNGRPGPTFTAVDPFDVHKKLVLYSSFTLLPIPAHLLPPAQTSYEPSVEDGLLIPYQQINQVQPVPLEEIERRLDELLPGQPIPDDLRADTELTGLASNVLRQNSDQTFAPTSTQLLVELRRQNNLTSFHQKHIQLLPELINHLENGGVAFDAFASHVELDALASEIVKLMARTNGDIVSDDVKAELELRIREGSSPNIIDHNIHQLQCTLSQVLQQITREEGGGIEVPQSLKDNILYVQIQSYLANNRIMSTHEVMRDDLEQRITVLRGKRKRQLGSNTTGRGFSQVPDESSAGRGNWRSAPSLTAGQTPQSSSSSVVVRRGVLKFNVQTESFAGLPPGFQFDPAWRYGGGGNNKDFNLQILKYYVNDGPPGPNEGEKAYKIRVKRAVENMGIERRVFPTVSDVEVLGFGNNKVGLLQARTATRKKYLKDANRHSIRLMENEEPYTIQWVAEKRARQARNAVRRREAQEKLRADLASRPESLGMRLPTPPPPDDSGDELYDFTDQQGPRMAQSRDFKLEKSRSKAAGFYGKPDRRVANDYSEATLEQLKTTIRCAACFSASAYCDISYTGRPCTRCESNGIQCLDREQEINYTFINRQTAPGTNTGKDDGPAKSEKGANPGFKNSFSTDEVFREYRGRTQVVTEGDDLSKRNRDRRSQSPAGIFARNSDFGNAYFVPCDNCIVNGRSCDDDGPPCRSCVLNGVEATCDVGALAGQPYQAQPAMISSDPAQLGLVLKTGVPDLDPWSRVNALLEEGISLTSGAELINPFQEVPFAPQTAMDWTDTDDLLNFSSNAARANPSAEMTAQSMNWMANEPADPSKETRYNSFGQELDMHGQIIPNGKMRRENTIPDPDYPLDSVENGFFGADPFSINTMNDQVEVNNFFDPNIDPNLDLFSFVTDMDDTAMGGISDEPINPQLPNDALSFGQDPSRQPDYNIPDGPVLPDIDPLPTLQGIPAENSEPCFEDPEHFSNWTGAICGNVPTKACDHTAHTQIHCICISCHASQNQVFSATQEAVIASTKRYMCGTCSSNARYLVQNDLPVAEEKDPNEKVMVGMCSCTLQMRKSWLCHQHREQAITRVKTRTAVMEDIFIRASGVGGVKCPFCLKREMDANSGGWGCKACYRYVVDG